LIYANVTYDDILLKVCLRLLQCLFLWTYSPSSVDDAYLMNLSNWCYIYYSYVHNKEPVYLGFQEKKGTKIIIVGQDFHITKVTNLTTISEDLVPSLFLVHVWHLVPSLFLVHVWHLVPSLFLVFLYYIIK
jgi:hypothetical protein